MKQHSVRYLARKEDRWSCYVIYIAPMYNHAFTSFFWLPCLIETNVPLECGVFPLGGQHRRDLRPRCAPRQRLSGQPFSKGPLCLMGGSRKIPAPLVTAILLRLRKSTFAIYMRAFLQLRDWIAWKYPILKQYKQAQQSESEQAPEEKNIQKHMTLLKMLLDSNWSIHVLACVYYDISSNVTKLFIHQIHIGYLDESNV